MSSLPLLFESASVNRVGPVPESRPNISGKSKTIKRRANKSKASASLRTAALLAESRTVASQKRVNALSDQIRKDKARIDQLHGANSALTKQIIKLRSDLALLHGKRDNLKAQLESIATSSTPVLQTACKLNLLSLPTKRPADCP